jgi:hypothetical protein
MFPDQQNQPGGTVTPQQAPNGQYDIVPPLPAGQNTGHSGHNPYEFIVNPATPKRSGRMFSGNKFVIQIALLLGGVLVLVIIGAIVISALAPKSNTADLESLVETQAELVRVASEGAGQASAQDVQNFVANLELSLSSNQTQLTNYLTAHGATLNSKQLASKQNSQTDTLLTNAIATNTYDSALMTTLNSELTNYQAAIQATYKLTMVTKTKQLLQAEYTAASLLLQQAKTVNTSDDS